MLATVSRTDAEIHQALFDLSQAISGHGDLGGLCCGLARALQSVVEFDYLGLLLYDAPRNGMRLYSFPNGSSNGAEVSRTLPMESPEGWVWRNQKPLVISPVAEEMRWPDFSARVLQKGICSISLVPLTAGESRVGVLGFGSRNLYQPNEAELAFLERVASEFAVAVELFLMRQTAERERDRLRVLFDITNVLVSKLGRDELFAAIATELSKILAYDFAALTVFHREVNEMQVHALHFTGPARLRIDRTSVSLEGMPAGEAIARGAPVVLNRPDRDRFPSPFYRELVQAGAGATCSFPLTTRNGTIGTLEVGRLSCAPFTEEDVEVGAQVARQIAIAVENSMAYRELAEMRDKLATEKLYLEDEIRSDQNLGNMVGESPAFQSLLKSVQIVAPTDATVLILGETGSGKELVARAIHEKSGRHNRNFVKLSCAAIPATLLESELFGHEKGAFTGAIGQKIGRFELADQGTLFLDEVGEIPLELQSKLLRAVQEQEFERLGSNRTIHVDVRLIAATNRNLKAMVDENTFRSDLYYRLHVFPIQVPPLRERREDIPLLVRFFVQRYASRMGRGIDSIPSSAMEMLARYDWPGNIRELQNAIERSVILTAGNVLTVAMPEALTIAGAPAPRRSEEAQAAERQNILRALKEARGMVGGPRGAAARLGLKRTTLQSRMRKLGIGREYR